MAARTFVSRFPVRSYELDILAHVNNAVYLNWLEQARLAAFDEIGYPLDALVERRWVTNVVRIEIDYRRPVVHGQTVVCRTELEGVGRTSLTLGHRLEVEGDPHPPAAEARVVVV